MICLGYTTFPFGWYKNTADDTVKELVACEATCLSCLGALATDCMACLPEATTNNAMKLQKLKEPHLIGQCVLECSAGYYQSGDECILCHSECVECDGPFRDDCRSCAEVDGEKPVLHVIQPGNTSGFCLESCEYGAYDEDANRCILNGNPLFSLAFILILRTM
jgi:proprotein convertase subtilisin/kexin type 5